jgi:transcriptional regulator of acetoin/glycerol metabolism
LAYWRRYEATRDPTWAAKAEGASREALRLGPELAEPQVELPRTLQEARDQAERALLVDALTRNAGNITRAARDIDVSRPTLHDLLRKHGLEADRYRRPGTTEDEADPEVVQEEP